MEKKCGFKDWLNCTKECRWFETCTRNPYRKEVKKAGRVYITLPVAVEVNNESNN